MIPPGRNRDLSVLILQKCMPVSILSRFEGQRDGGRGSAFASNGIFISFDRSGTGLRKCAPGRRNHTPYFRLCSKALERRVFGSPRAVSTVQAEAGGCANRLFSKASAA